MKKTKKELAKEIEYYKNKLYETEIILDKALIILESYIKEEEPYTIKDVLKFIHLIQEKCPAIGGEIYDLIQEDTRETMISLQNFVIDRCISDDIIEYIAYMLKIDFSDVARNMRGEIVEAIQWHSIEEQYYLEGKITIEDVYNEIKDDLIDISKWFKDELNGLQ